MLFAIGKFPWDFPNNSKFGNILEGNECRDAALIFPSILNSKITRLRRRNIFLYFLPLEKCQFKKWIKRESNLLMDELCSKGVKKEFVFLRVEKILLLNVNSAKNANFASKKAGNGQMNKLRMAGKFAQRDFFFNL